MRLDLSIIATLTIFMSTSSLDAQPYTLTNSGGEIVFDIPTGVGSTEVSYSVIDNNAPFDVTAGFSLAVINSPLVSATAVNPSPILAALNTGTGPADFL